MRYRTALASIFFVVMLLAVVVFLCVTFFKKKKDNELEAVREKKRSENMQMMAALSLAN